LQGAGTFHQNLIDLTDNNLTQQTPVTGTTPWNLLPASFAARTVLKQQNTIFSQSSNQNNSGSLSQSNRNPVVAQGKKRALISSTTTSELIWRAREPSVSPPLRHQQLPSFRPHRPLNPAPSPHQSPVQSEEDSEDDMSGNIRSFCGADSEDIEEFFRQIESHGAMKQWDSQRKLHVVESLLWGPALQQYNNEKAQGGVIANEDQANGVQPGRHYLERYNIRKRWLLGKYNGAE
jgi:hypothetical protein